MDKDIKRLQKFNWLLSQEDRAHAEAIVDRAINLAATAGIPLGDRVDRVMDLIACHNHACPLDFEKLLRADDFNLMHDVLGIRNCLNRTTGHLKNHFLPRCARPQARA
jgi:hypothetical protein